MVRRDTVGHFCFWNPQNSVCRIKDRAMSLQTAAETVVETITAMASEGVPLMQRVLPEKEAEYWKHYPKGDAKDANCQSRWYYHVHAPGKRHPEEHGHFHLFLHRDQLGDVGEPIIGPTKPPKKGNKIAQVTHIAGLSINTIGIPRAWFVTNHWVTAEFLYPAEVMIDHLPQFNVDETPQDSLVNRCVTAMVELYRDELTELLRQRDAAMKAHVAEEGEAAYRNKTYEILGEIPIDLDAKIASV